MSPASMTLAYQIWGDCRLHGWSRTVAEVADSIDRPATRVRRVAQLQGWLPRFRAASDGHRDLPLVTVTMDRHLADLAGDRDFDDLVAP